MWGDGPKIDDAETAADAALERSRAMAAGGQARAGLANVKQAVRLYRQLADKEPHVYRPDLAFALQAQSDIASAAERSDDALGAAREAVDMFRAMAADDGSDYGMFEDDAAQVGEPTTSSGTGEAENDAQRDGGETHGDDAKARETHEATENGSDAALFGPYLGSALATLAARLHESGADAEALATVREGIHLFDDASADDLRRHRTVLDAARLLRNELSPDEHFLDEEFGEEFVEKHAEGESHAARGSST